MLKTIFLAMLVFVVATTNATTYYFSANSGDDSRPAYLAQNPLTPWKTINKLNSIFSSLQPGDQVLLKRGETFYGSIVISKSREKYAHGTSNSKVPIIVGAYGVGDKPVITGLQNITNWTGIGSGIYETQLAQNELNMVTFQGVLQPMGRWPKVTAPKAGYLTLQSHYMSSNITSNAIASANNFTGGELVIRKWGWIMDRGLITNQTSSTVSYTPFTAPEHPNFNYEPINGFGFFFQNHINALTELGDWMYDRNSKKLRVFFGGNSPYSFNTEAATVENLIDIVSSTYITLDNLQLRGSNSNGILLNYAYDIKITNCDINLSGVDGIKTGKWTESSDIDLKNCTIINSNNNALTAHGTARWNIQNNVIRNSGIIRGMGLSGDGMYNGICAPGSNSIIEFNEIRNTGYNAIEFKGVNTIIRNNFIDTFCTLKSDGGGIYNSAEMGLTGRKIIANVVINGIGDMNGRKEEEASNPFAGNVHGIYMDGGATDVDIFDNTAANCSGTGIELSSPTNMTVSNNTFFNNTHAQAFYWESKGPISNLSVKNNIFFALKRNQLVSLIAGSSNTVPGWGPMNNNYYCRPLSEPASIDTGGYSRPSYDDYTDGGIIQAYNQRFYSLDKWQAMTNQDGGSKKTAVQIPDQSFVRFEYATSSARTISLDAVYLDVKGNGYSNSVTLAPYTSIILIKTSASVPLSNQTITFNPLSDRSVNAPAFNLTASASSNLPVSFRVVSGPANISGNTVTTTGIGRVVIEASQAGNGSYYAAAPVTQAFNVLPAQSVCNVVFLNNGQIILAPTCGNSDGNITIEPLAGTAPFLYSIDGGVTYVPGANYGHTFGNLPAGVYRLRLKDANGCESNVAERTLSSANCGGGTTCTPPTILNNGQIVLDASCGNSDGNVTLIPTSGVAPFLYSINGGVTYVSGPNYGYTFSNLSAGSYQLRIKDANGCESNTVNKNVKNYYGGPCNGRITGSIAATVGLSVVQPSVTDGTQKMRSYPNPSNGQFKVEFLNFTPGKAEVIIVDGKGATVKRIPMNMTNSFSQTIDVNLTGQTPGLYYIKVTGAAGTKTTKILIQ